MEFQNDNTNEFRFPLLQLSCSTVIDKMQKLSVCLEISGVLFENGTEQHLSASH